jgi:hypothetical protein
VTDKELSLNDTAILAEHAHQIRQVIKRAAAVTAIEVGKRLKECKKRCGHGNWKPWLEREFQWSERQAQLYIQAHEKFGCHKDAIDEPGCGFDFTGLPVKALFALSAPSTPKQAVTEVQARTSKGETLTTKDVKGIIAKAKPPNPDPEPDDADEGEHVAENDEAEGSDIVDYTPAKQPAPLPPAPAATVKPGFECGDPPCMRLRQAYRRHNELTDQIDDLKEKLEQAAEAQALLNAMEQVLGDEWGIAVKEAEKVMNKQRRR